jgi:predicted nucleic-acid-binding protein
VRLTLDTNILVRAFTNDDPEQAAQARTLLDQASLAVIPVPTLCEFSWVLSRSFKIAPADIAAVIAEIVDSETILTDIPAVEAGLTMLRAGGDFADGAIALQGRAAGGMIFASFDKRAVELWQRQGGQASDPAALLSVSDQ